jgi:hypothetical protein
VTAATHTGETLLRKSRALDRGALVARLRMLTQLLLAYEIALNDGATEHSATFEE